MTRNWKLSEFPFYPLLLAAYFPLDLMAADVDGTVSLIDVVRPLVYSVHVKTRKFRNLEKTKRYVVPAPRANSKTQGGTRIDSDSICTAITLFFRVFKRPEYSVLRIILIACETNSVTQAFNSLHGKWFSLG